MTMILTSSDSPSLFHADGGGKAANLARITRHGLRVPAWFCLSACAFDAFVHQHGLHYLLTPAGDRRQFARRVEQLFLSKPLPAQVEDELFRMIETMNLGDAFLAVRSSAIDEDSPTASFAGQLSSFLYQKGDDAISASVRRCWASGFSERALTYRQEQGLPVSDIRVAVVIQEMVPAEVSGVAFSRNPTAPLDREQIIVDAVYGLGEGLVSGALESDHFTIDRRTQAIEAKIACKAEAYRQRVQGGIQLAPVPAEDRARPCLSHQQVKKVAEQVQCLEELMGSPQDCEWALDQDGQLFLLQTRPITTLPPPAFYDKQIIGPEYALWDNANIIESYEGITSPLTFSFASRAYRQVYIQFCQIMGIPRHVVEQQDAMFRNMLGLIQGRIFYNLINWYRLIRMLPVGGRSDAFMETMMGVRQSLGPELSTLFDDLQEPPRPSRLRQLAVAATTVWHFLRLDRIVEEFQTRFNVVYESSRRLDFDTMSLNALLEHYVAIEEELLQRWHAPIINDYLCMIFFGLLKKLTESWICPDLPETSTAEDPQPQLADASSLQNDLLCGEGGLVSTAPTRMLMKIAARIDEGDAQTRAWFIESPPAQLWRERDQAPHIAAMIDNFLDLYGFRSVNELKLEEPDLHDDPAFVISAIARYVRDNAYDVDAMIEREKAIRNAAESRIDSALSWWKRPVYRWVLKQARRTVRQRENLRFDRTKVFGLARHLFRGIGLQLVRLHVLKGVDDVFYLTVDEIFAFVEGRLAVTDLGGMATFRRQEYARFRQAPPPPDRFLTQGAVGVWARQPQLLDAADLLRPELDQRASDDPNILTGTPCCPGVVEGVVLVARTPKEAEQLDQQILVTARTDPGWVPLYPSCTGLLIERGSLLSHSAVVARELGLPTIVGITGGLMQKLRTGQRVRMDASKGEVKILP